MTDYYYCTECGNIVELEYNGGGGLSCCGTPMKKLEAKTGNPAEEKHVPYFEYVDGGVLVKVGKEAAHPMTAEHQIVFIGIIADGVIMKKFLRPDEPAEAFFKTDAKDIKACELCNKHGFWIYS